MSTATAAKTMTQTWQTLCTHADLVPYSGIAAWVETAEGPAQVAIFYLPGHDQELYALDHHDPSPAPTSSPAASSATSRQPVVASPIYKQHFRLEDGQCLEDESVILRTWKVSFKGDEVWIEA